MAGSASGAAAGTAGGTGGRPARDYRSAARHLLGGRDRARRLAAGVAAGGRAPAVPVARPVRAPGASGGDRRLPAPLTRAGRRAGAGPDHPGGVERARAARGRAPDAGRPGRHRGTRLPHRPRGAAPGRGAGRAVPGRRARHRSRGTPRRSHVALHHARPSVPARRAASGEPQAGTDRVGQGHRRDHRRGRLRQRVPLRRRPAAGAAQHGPRRHRLPRHGVEDPRHRLRRGLAGRAARARRQAGGAAPAARRPHPRAGAARDPRPAPLGRPGAPYPQDAPGVRPPPRRPGRRPDPRRPGHGGAGRRTGRRSGCSATPPGCTWSSSFPATSPSTA